MYIYMYIYMYTPAEESCVEDYQPPGLRSQRPRIMAWDLKELCGFIDVP